MIQDPVRTQRSNNKIHITFAWIISSAITSESLTLTNKSTRDLKVGFDVHQLVITAAQALCFGLGGVWSSCYDLISIKSTSTYCANIIILNVYSTHSRGVLPLPQDEDKSVEALQVGSLWQFSEDPSTHSSVAWLQLFVILIGILSLVQCLGESQSSVAHWNQVNLYLTWILEVWVHSTLVVPNTLSTIGGAGTEEKYCQLVLWLSGLDEASP